MDERRRSIRDPTYLPGVIYFNHGRDSLSCVIHDYSYEGARIVIFDPINVPNEVELHIPERNRLVHATVRWRHGNKIGLAFSEARPASYHKASRALLLRVRARARESAKKVVTYQRSVHTHLRRVMGAAHGTVSSPSIAASKSWRYRRRMI
jgi:hypothetical protein